jgi:hypothetical protein
MNNVGGGGVYHAPLLHMYEQSIYTVCTILGNSSSTALYGQYIYSAILGNPAPLLYCLDNIHIYSSILGIGNPAPLYSLVNTG